MAYDCEIRTAHEWSWVLFGLNIFTAGDRIDFLLYKNGLKKSYTLVFIENKSKNFNNQVRELFN